MTDDHLIILKKLSCFVNEIKEQPYQTENAEFVADAIESYLEGKSKSLNAAFGLIPKRGAPGNKELRLDTARQMLKMEFNGMSMRQIADEIPRFDERKLRRIMAEFVNQVMSEELERRLKE